jgi:cell division protein FtsW (lipid II flippase)
MAIGSWRLIVGAAITLGTLDWVGKLMIADRLALASGPSSVSLLAWCVGLAALFVIGALVRPDALSLLAPAACLVVVGDLITFRFQLSGSSTDSEAPLLSAIAIVAGLAVFRDMRRIAEYARLLGVIGLVLIGLPLLPLVGAEVGSQRVAVHLGSMFVMPGELGRPLVMLGLASGLTSLPFVEGADVRFRDCRPELFRAVTLSVAAVFVQLAEGDLGPAVVVAVATVMGIAATTGRIRWMLGGVTILAYALTLGASLSRTIDGRVQDVLDPFRLSGGGYMQAGLAHLGLAWGQWWGIGLGGGVVGAGRQGSLPLGSSDLALVTWGTEAGLIGVVVVVALFATLIWKLFTISMDAPHGFPRVAGYCFASIVCTQVVWVVGAVLGLLPLSGLATPFVSAGRSAPMALAFMLGFACRLPRTSHASMPVRGLDPLRAIRLLRNGCVVCLLALTVVASAHIEAQATRLDRRPNNPLRELATLRRGTIRDANGLPLAWTTGSGSLQTVSRRYAHGLADVVGRMSQVNAGNGMELAWGPTLRCAGSGQAATGEASTSVFGDPGRCAPASLTLTIEDRLQRIAERALNGLTGAVVVIDARDGTVLTMAGNDLTRPREPAGLRLGAQTVLAPGSTFKTVTAAAALTAGVDTETTVRSAWNAQDGPEIHNAGGESCGGTLEAALVLSCNTSFADIATRVGVGRLRQTADALGFGSPTPLSGMPTSVSSTLQPGVDQAGVAAAGFGQGTVVASPLQMAVVAASFANGGYRVEPSLVTAVCSGRTLLASPIRRPVRVLTSLISTKIAAYMRDVTSAGTAHGLHAADDWATKTGTAELPTLRDPRTPAGTGGWIIGFPTTGPERDDIAVAVLVLPDREHLERNGPVDAVGVLHAVAPAVLEAGRRGKDRSAHC